MDGFPRTRAEEEAVELAGLRDRSGAFLHAVVTVAGKDCRLYPELRHSVAALRDALADLESDIDGLIASRTSFPIAAE